MLISQIRSIDRISNGGGCRIIGIANNHNTTDSHGTRFVFTDECLRKSQGGPVLFNHNQDWPVGVNQSMRVVSDGLEVEDIIHEDARGPNGLLVIDMLERGIIPAFSIRFDGQAKITQTREYDVITPNFLPEHSLVTLPSNRESKISNVTRSILEELDKTPEGQAISRIYRIGFGGSRMDENEVVEEVVETVEEVIVEETVEDGRKYEDIRGIIDTGDARIDEILYIARDFKALLPMLTKVVQDVQTALPIVMDYITCEMEDDVLEQEQEMMDTTNSSMMRMEEASWLDAVKLALK